MAKKAAPQMYVPILRVDEEERMVYGYGTREDVVDSYGTIIDLDSVRKALPDYMQWRNVREMHQSSAVGTADEITIDDKGVQLGVKVVDDVAWNKVKTGVYKGFSIGGKKDYQDGNRIFLKEITEFSLVDRPSNGGCPFEEFRIYGGDEEMEETAEVATQEVAEVVETNVAETEVVQERVDAPEIVEVVDTTVAQEVVEERTEVVETEVVEEVVELSAEPEIKRYAGEEVYDAKMAISALECVQTLLLFEQNEVKGEDSGQVADLKIVIEKLKSFIASEIMEDNSAPEEPVELSAVPEVTRQAKRYASDDKDRIKRIMEIARELGAEDEDDNEEECNMSSESDITRMSSDLHVAQDEITRLAGVNSDLVARIAALEAEPEAPKGILRVIGKENDTVSETAVTRVEETEQFRNATDHEKALLLTRAAFAAPLNIGPRY
jgi:hypothetical protein